MYVSETVNTQSSVEINDFSNCFFFCFSLQRHSKTELISRYSNAMPSLIRALLFPLLLVPPPMLTPDDVVDVGADLFGGVHEFVELVVHLRCTAYTRATKNVYPLSNI